MQQLRLFFIALQFFTRLPIPRWVGFQPAWLHQSSRYFPLVGVVVAAIAAGVYWLAALLFPTPVAAVLSTAADIPQIKAGKNRKPSMLPIRPAERAAVLPVS